VEVKSGDVTVDQPTLKSTAPDLTDTSCRIDCAAAAVRRSGTVYRGIWVAKSLSALAA
jgi:hypothetical protein